MKDVKDIAPYLNSRVVVKISGYYVKGFLRGVSHDAIELTGAATISTPNVCQPFNYEERYYDWLIISPYNIQSIRKTKKKKRGNYVEHL